MRTLKVDVGHSQYLITIGSGLLADRALIESQAPARDVMVVTNTTVARLYLQRLREGLGGRNISECILPDGEQHKTLQTAGWVFDELVGKKLNRDGIVLALGGGVVGDIAGFAAACYQRGIGYVQIPTTLLAQVDSSVGGKTGVNHTGGKNLIGAFHQPLAVIADTDTLSTLPDRELSAGLAEVIKYGCIADFEFLGWLDSNMEKLLGRDVEALTYAVARSCEIKAVIVGEDEREHGRRAILNFGHTFGHAIEAATGFERYLHGEAVALGMVMAADFSRELGLIDAAATERVDGLLRRAGLPTEAPKVGAARALELMRMDKKVLAGKVRLVLLERLGSGIVVSKYPERTLETTLREHLA
ncbi:MAG TPA: 3-dehydroquinate synthase [Steroidobacteraceae bacterium]